MNPKKVVRRVVPKSGVRAIENSYRKSRGVFWQTTHGFPAKGMRVIAVTGTNGKTTTCSYISEVLKAAGCSTAVYTTAYYEINGVHTPNRTHMTVSSQRDVQSFFAKAKRGNVDFVILEVTSHALEQGRIAGVPVEVAVITNLTQDHLDYHGTMEAYGAAKARLFQEYGAQFAVLNADDKWYDFFNAKSKGITITYGSAKDSSVRLASTKLGAGGSDFTVVDSGNKFQAKTHLVGEFNIYNALAALSVAKAVGMDMGQAVHGVSNLLAVPGRMEPIVAGQNFQVLVDFAYTPDALQNVLGTLKKVAKGKVSIVFGATGDRDKTKRGPMGEVVARLADRIYLTDDETYTENPETIRREVYAGIKRAKGTAKTEVFDDRLTAIKRAFKEAKPGDVVLLAGIGHEDYRNMGGKKLPWDERQVARALLQKTSG